MASAAASRPPPPPPPPPPMPLTSQWLSPRVSFSLDDNAGSGGGVGGREAAEAAAAGKQSTDFEFLLAGCAAAVSMLPADELFSGGKLVPLQLPTPKHTISSSESTAEAPPLSSHLEHTVQTADEEDEQPKISTRRWRDLLRLRKQHASSPETRPLRRLLRRSPKPPVLEPSLSLPLLCDADVSDEPDEPEKPMPMPLPTRTPSPAPTQHLPPKIRPSLAPAPASPPPPPPPPPAVLAAESPRLNAAGKVVFDGHGQSSSSPSSCRAGAGHRRSMEWSYSAHVRAATVLNVPVCTLRGSSRKSVSVFGIDRLLPPAAASSSSAGKRGKVVRKDAAMTR